MPASLERLALRRRRAWLRWSLVKTRAALDWLCFWDAALHAAEQKRYG